MEGGREEGGGGRRRERIKKALISLTCVCAVLVVGKCNFVCELVNPLLGKYSLIFFDGSILGLFPVRHMIVT